MDIDHQNDVYRRNGVDDVIKVTPNLEKNVKVYVILPLPISKL